MGNRAVEVRGGVVGLASGLLLVSYLHHPPPASTSLHHPDIHAEYVKYPSGKDTITALGAFVVCYGPGPEAAAIARIRASGLGVYAENDARIDAGLTDVAAAVKQYAKDYHYAIYPGVGHGFLRSREKPEVADSAWRAVIQFFRQRLER